MRTISYGFFGEDSAQRVFLDSYLDRLNQEHKRVLRFQASELFNRTFLGIDQRDIDRRVGAAAEQGFGLNQFKLQCLFVGRDLDSDAATAYDHRVAVLHSSIPTSVHPKTLLLLPMQCIEHWVLYLKLNEHDTEPLEALSNKAAQEQLYGVSKIASSHRKEVVRELTKDLRINWLANRSPTFKLFHQQVQAYLAALSAA